VRRLTIKHTDIETSAVGFGTAQLTSLDSTKRALALLGAAYDTGITHFDVARAYGFGQTERILGSFLAGHRDRVTVTTKFGLEPPPFAQATAGIIPLARRVLRRFPALAKRAHRVAAMTVPPNTYSAGRAAASLETSLREMRTDYVDLFLVHEGSLDHARNDELLRFLDDQIARGTVRAYGMATNHAGLTGDAGVFPRSMSVFQFENDAARRQRQAIRGLGDRAVITHTALYPLGAIADAARLRPRVAAEFKARTGLDLERREQVAPLLLQFAATDNADGVVLFGTTSIEHLRTNAHAMSAAESSSDPVSSFAAILPELLLPNEVERTATVSNA